MSGCDDTCTADCGRCKGLTPTRAARAGLVRQEWCPGGNRCMKATKGGDMRCNGRARWCDTAAGERYDRYVIGAPREPGSYAYKLCNRHALRHAAAIEAACQPTVSVGATS